MLFHLKKAVTLEQQKALTQHEHLVEQRFKTCAPFVDVWTPFGKQLQQ